jgi:hypothetical protein
LATRRTPSELIQKQASDGTPRPVHSRPCGLPPPPSPWA